ncbi:hypothetical protein Trydic_g1983 [Trypoxylus dichotomus]
MRLTVFPFKSRRGPLISALALIWKYSRSNSTHAVTACPLGKEDQTFPLMSYTVQKLSSDHYSMITETHLTLPDSDRPFAHFRVLPNKESPYCCLQQKTVHRHVVFRSSEGV